MRNTRMKQIMVLVYLLATAALFAPIMSGSIVGERVGGVFVIRGYNLVEFAPAAWIMLLSPLILTVSRFLLSSDFLRTRVWRIALAFSFAAYLTSLPYAWSWLRKEMDAASVHSVGIILYPVLIGIALLLESKRDMPELKHVEKDGAEG